MGASGWSYFIKYERDASRALIALQQRVFNRCEYGQTDFSRTIASQILEETEEKVLIRDVKLYVVAKWAEAASRGEIEPGTSMPEVQITSALTAEFRRERNRHLQTWLGKQNPKFSSIEAVKTHFGEAGTHSIIDISGISAKPAPFHASPLPIEDIVRIFGNSKPTRPSIESTLLPLNSTVASWHAWYMPVWTGSKKSHYYFEGASGD
ncbi:MAG TPA: hypothetical protein VF595_16195 [Tepidisphaeraceae bacterium]|jgi:hypothetical protein